MSDARFNVVFQGHMVAGANPDAVKANFARLFRIDAPEKVAAYFSGRRVVLKKDADQATAMKLRATLKQAGALCDLEAVEGEEVVVAAPAPVSEPAPPVKASAAQITPEAVTSLHDSGGGREMVGTIRTGGEGFVGAFSVAPVGATMDQEKREENVVVPDVSGIQLAPAGSDMGQIKETRPPVAPDISHLKLV